MSRWQTIWLSATTVLALAAGALSLWLALAPRLVPQAPVPPQLVVAAADAPTVGVLDRNDALMLIRTSIVALNQANQTGNYTVLRDIGAPGFRAGNTPERLAEIFADLRNNRYDLSPAVVLEPRFLIAPRLEDNGRLRMAGFLPSMPMQVNFDLLFAAVDNRWRLFGIAINVGPPGPAPPTLAPAPQAPTANSPAPAPQPPIVSPAAPAPPR